MGSDDGQKPTNDSRSKNLVVRSLISGSISSITTTIIYQPLELLKTQIQLRDNKTLHKTNQILGKTTSSALALARGRGLSYLWRGTGVSLLRSGPGVGLYYASLSLLQQNFSNNCDKPNSPSQAFYFGLVARSAVTFILLPVTVTKVRYESGWFNYPNLSVAIRDAYMRTGWIGITPTILRDSLFSGTYYMFYTTLKSSKFITQHDDSSVYQRNFICGILSGLVASVITNPLDVVKTKIQVNELKRSGAIRETVKGILRESNGYMRFLDGLGPRSLRRTLMTATTWTFYEFMIESIR